MPENYKDIETSQENDSLIATEASSMDAPVIDDANTAPETADVANGGDLSDVEELSPEQLTMDIPVENEASDEPIEEVEKPSESFSELLLSKAPDYNPEKPRRVDAIFDFVELLLLTLAAVFVLTTFFVRHSIVNGNSMQNTLQNGDVLIISDLFYTPKQYDIVVLEDHTTGYDHPLVKRVIAVEGDEVVITENAIFVNGEPVRDDFVYIGTKDYSYAPDSLTVPKGEIFVLGDHRDDSTDSRVFGSVSVDAVLGKVLFRIYPFSELGTVYTKEN